jgi:hypothetical protein
MIYENTFATSLFQNAFIAPQGIKAVALVDFPPDSHSEHSS